MQLCARLSLVKNASEIRLSFRKHWWYFTSSLTFTNYVENTSKLFETYRPMSSLMAGMIVFNLREKLYS